MVISAFSSNREQLAEDRRGEQGAWLFLISLAVFFLACMILYVVYVLLRMAPDPQAANPQELQPFYIPRSFLLTTVNLVAISVLLHQAVSAVRNERHTDLARYLILAFVLAIVFFVIQGVGLSWMISQLLQPGRAMRNLYGFTFFLVVVHALHVVGGVAGMVMLLFGMIRKSYDHERNFPIRFCAMYWHFLDVVWLIMLAGFAVAAFVSKG